MQELSNKYRAEARLSRNPGASLLGVLYPAICHQGAAIACLRHQLLTTTKQPADGKSHLAIMISLVIASSSRVTANSNHGCNSKLSASKPFSLLPYTLSLHLHCVKSIAATCSIQAQSQAVRFACSGTRLRKRRPALMRQPRK